MHSFEKLYIPNDVVSHNPTKHEKEHNDPKHLSSRNNAHPTSCDNWKLLQASSIFHLLSAAHPQYGPRQLKGKITNKSTVHSSEVITPLAAKVIYLVKPVIENSYSWTGKQSRPRHLSCNTTWNKKPHLKTDVLEEISSLIIAKSASTSNGAAKSRSIPPKKNKFT